MQISKLRIKNFRSIKDSGEIELTKLYALIGKNNTGKSAVLKAIQIVWGDIEVTDSDFHKKVSEDIEIEIFLKNYNDEKYQELFLNKDKKEQEEIKLKITISPDLKERAFLNDEEKSPKTIRGKLPSLLIIPDIRNPEKESTAGAKSFLKKLIDQIESQGVFEQEKKEHIEKIREIIEKDIEKISKITTQKIQNILNNKLKVSINPEINIAKAVSYNTDLISDENNVAKLLSSGTGIQSIFILALLETYAEMIQSNDSILLIEEPEVYLHPELQRRMFDAIRLIANSNQVIFTTHSPVMISEIWINDSIKLVKIENGETKFENMDIKSIIDELGIKYEDVLNPKVIVFVEGPTDVLFYNAVVSLLKPKLEEEQKERRIKFIDSNGVRNIKTFAYIKIINSDRVKNNFYVIKDGDGRNPEGAKNDLAKNIEDQVGEVINKEDGIGLKERIYVLSDYAIESYLLNENLITTVFPELKKESIAFMIGHYRKKYEEAINGLKTSGYSKDQYGKFKTYFTPKHFFTNNELQNDKKRKKFEAIFENNEEFSKARNLLAEKCDGLKEDYIVTFLSKISDRGIIKEPVSIMEKILSESEK